MQTHAAASRELSIRRRDGTIIGGEIVSVDDAAAATLVVVHGAAQAGHHYRDLANALVVGGACRVVLYDRRGRGRSGPAGALDDEIEDLRAVAEATRAQLVFGHSAGGMVALEAARAFPSLFARVAVYEPAVLLADLAQTGVFPTAWLAPFERALAEGRAGRAFAIFANALEVAPPGSVPRPLFHLLVRALLRTPMGAEMKALLATAPHDIRMALSLAGGPARYASVAAPTLVLAGERSARFLVAAAVAVSAALPCAIDERVAGADHIAPLFQPGLVAPPLTRFLTDGAPIPNAHRDKALAAR